MLLEIKDLCVSFENDEGELVSAVEGVNLTLERGEILGLVGESGCGKSLTALSLGGLVDRAEISGKVGGAPKISYIFQNPMQSLNPVMKVGAQIAESLGKTDKSEITGLLKAVSLPPETMKKYPCNLSGGQQQRVMIAMALAAKSDLIVADEPTTALDVITQKEVLDLVDRVSRERFTAVLLITHNLGLVARYSDFVNVMYAGEIVESGKVVEVLRSPRHPYTQGLAAAVPRLDAPKGTDLYDIKGTVPPPTDWPIGCAFSPRCPKAVKACSESTFVTCPYVDASGENIMV
jgi:oligopeptide/dipeptide ABC transporter ATP-binding protein